MLNRLKPGKTNKRYKVATEQPAETANGEKTAPKAQMLEINMLRNETSKSKPFQFEIVESGELQELRYNVVRSDVGSAAEPVASTLGNTNTKLLKNNANTAEADIKG